MSMLGDTLNRFQASNLESSMAKLVVTSESMKDRAFELTGEKITVGRLPDNQIHLEDNTVSSYHAELTLKGDDYIVRDLNSTNGTRVNGNRVVQTRLSHGDTIWFGHLELQYYSSTTKSTTQPLPSQPKKVVDLSASTTRSTARPTSYGSASPFAKEKKRSTSKTSLQIAVIVLGLIAIGLLGYFILKVLNV